MAANFLLSAFLSAVVPFSSVTPTPAPMNATPVPTVAQVASPGTTPPVNSLIWVVKPGESARSIAAAYYGNDRYYTTIWNDNPEITGQDQLSEGVVIHLRKELQSSPEPLPVTAAMDTRDPRSLTDAEKYGYIMTHTVNYGNVTWSMPLLSYKRISTFFSSGHPGLDMTTFYNTPIYAATDGTVVEAGWSHLGYGRSTVIAHANGFRTRYAHMSFLKVSVGQTVSRGAEIGAAGCTGHCTGTHLHFEVYEGNYPIDPRKVIHLW